MADKQKRKWWKKGGGTVSSTTPSSQQKPKKLFQRAKQSKESQQKQIITKSQQEPLYKPLTQPIPKFKNADALTESEINQIQTDLYRVTQQRNQLETELNIRAKQISSLEENLQMMSDQSKVIARHAMEKEQQMIECQEALKLKTSQLEMYRTGGKSNLNRSTMLPMHLRGKFTEFLRGVLLQQKQFFDKALNHFVHKSISDDEIKYGVNPKIKVDCNKVRSSFIAEISKIGMNLMRDYVMELELRLNGIFHQANTPSQQQKQIQNPQQSQQMTQQQMQQMSQLQAMQAQMAKMEKSEQKTDNNNLNKDEMEAKFEKQLSGSVIVKNDDSDNKSVDLSNIDNEDDDNDDDDDDGNGMDPELKAMRKHMRTLTTKHLEKTIKHGGDGSAEINKIFSQFAAFKKGIERPSNAPTPFRVADKQTPFIELRDMLEALPYDLTKAILQEQQISKYDRIRDILFQRGCWPMIRFSSNRSKNLSSNVPFNDILMKIETYLTSQDIHKTKHSSRSREPGMYLLGTLDPQHTTGYRLHQISAIIRQRNESRHMITALTIRVGRIWQQKEDEIDEFDEDNDEDDDDEEEDNLVGDALDFFQSLTQPSLMLLLGANSSEKCALCRELSKQISTKYNQRTALVDTRSGVAGYLESPLETGQAVRFYVNSITNQSNIIDQTRSIFPQCVIVDEVLSENDINVVSKLQSEGISCIVGTNMHSLKALVGHPVFSKLLPPQHRLSGNKNSNTMSPHLLILEMEFQGNNVKMYKNIPDAVQSIKKKLEPPCRTYKVKWEDGYIQQKHSQNSQTSSMVFGHKFMNSISVNSGMSNMSNISTNNGMQQQFTNFQPQSPNTQMQMFNNTSKQLNMNKGNSAPVN